jgi:hypothetical protein
LFCGNVDGRFESEEHILQFVLGNSRASGLVDEEFVIPPGVVCDKCNGRRLSLRDKALVEWPPISAFRSLGQLRNRKGRLVDAVAGTRWQIEFHSEDRRTFELRVDARTDRGSRREDVARALCKIALEARWLDDPADAGSSRWDALAAAAIGGPLPENLAMGLVQPTQPWDIDLRPEAGVGVLPDCPELRMVCRVSIVGVRMLLVIGGPVPVLPGTAWWIVDRESRELRGPDSMWMRFGGRAATATRQRSPEPVPGPAAGLASRLPSGSPGMRIYLQPDAHADAGSP